MRIQPKTVIDQMNAERPDDVLADLEAKHGSQQRMVSLAPRETKRWWAVTTHGDVREVTGYSCAPTNPLVWWCPELGFSGTQGYHLFTCESAALTRAIIELKAEIEMKSKRLDLLETRLANI